LWKCTPSCVNMRHHHDHHSRGKPGSWEATCSSTDPGKSARSRPPALPINEAASHCLHCPAGSLCFGV
jgi:hypothetical protein